MPTGMFLIRVIRALQARGVEPVLVGGCAVALHGAVRGTVDVDLAITLQGIRLKRIALEERIRMKRASGRPQDLEDARALEQLR